MGRKGFLLLLFFFSGAGEEKAGLGLGGLGAGLRTITGTSFSVETIEVPTDVSYTLASGEGERGSEESEEKQSAGGATGGEDL